MPLGRPYIGEGIPLNIGRLSHDTLCQQGPGGVKVTGYGKNAEFCTFLVPVLRPMGREIPRDGIGLSYTEFGRRQGWAKRKAQSAKRGSVLSSEV